MVTGLVTGELAMGRLPKFNDTGDADIGVVAPAPVPLRVTVVTPFSEPLVVVALRDPAMEPMEVGVKVTGTVIVSPGFKVAGSGTLGAPLVYDDPDTANEDTTMEEALDGFAVNCAFTVTL
jgi:hypothetical protein